MAIVVVVIMVLTAIMAVVPVMVATVAPAVVARLIFRGSDEIHWPTTGIVFTTVLTPVARVLRRNV